MAEAPDHGTIPPSAEWIIARIKESPLSAGGCFLASYLASFVWPGAVCNLADMEDLDDGEQRQAILFLRCCQDDGLSIEQMTSILTKIRPYLIGIRKCDLH